MVIRLTMFWGARTIEDQTIEDQTIAIQGPTIATSGGTNLP
jgi:hypothetical protein